MLLFKDLVPQYNIQPYFQKKSWDAVKNVNKNRI